MADGASRKGDVGGRKPLNHKKTRRVELSKPAARPIRTNIKYDCLLQVLPTC